MNRPTLKQCQDQLAQIALNERPENWETDLSTIESSDGSKTTVLTLMWEGREAESVPREVRLCFGLDERLFMVLAVDPGLFAHCIEEGMDMKDADAAATRRLAGFEEIVNYLNRQAYKLADCS